MRTRWCPPTPRTSTTSTSSGSGRRAGRPFGTSSRAFTRARSDQPEDLYRVEKIRFLKPDVAIVQVSSHSITGDNIGTFVMEKQERSWLDGQLYQRRAARATVEEVNLP